MKDNLTEIIAILDRSGSMQQLTKDTIGGFNEFIKQQKAIPGEAIITTVLFDDQYELLHDGVNIQTVKELTEKEYYARGNTALLDAIGKALNTVGGKLDKLHEDQKPSKVIVLIITDGEENASREFTSDQIKKMVETQRNVYSWEFIFLGANIDSFDVANGLGIARSANYSATVRGTQSVYSAMSVAVSNYRNTGNVDDGEDYRKELK